MYLKISKHSGVSTFVVTNYLSSKLIYLNNGYLEYHHDVYNSTVFANFMAWAVANATFYGINTGGLPQQ